MVSPAGLACSRCSLPGLPGLLNFTGSLRLEETYRIIQTNHSPFTNGSR